jgi:hypothetical protein
MGNIRPNAIDPAKLDAFLARAVGDLSAGYGGVMVSLGNRLGLYRAMAGTGPLSSRELASRAGCAERYVREWLNAQVAGGYVAYHAISDTYELTPEQAFVLANEDSPVFIPNAWAVPASMWFDEDKAVEAFRTGKGIPGATMTGGSTAGSRPSTGMPTAAASSRSGCRLSRESSRSSRPAPSWPMSAAATGIRRRSWPRPSRPRGSTASIRIRDRWSRPNGSPPQQASTRRPSPWLGRTNIPARATT